ncbi:unnamed protein product, partial [Symbiodinium pilosum]
GSIIGALEAAAPAVQQEAIQNLVRDQYANTTRNTRDSRWNLWTRLATSWKLPPLPITAELVQAIASSLKRGRYRSSAQVFSMARQQHVAHTGCRLSADIEQQITMSIRSIERGLGPSTLKDAFIVEDLAAATDSSNTPPPAEDHWAEYLYDCVLVTPICCWWMLRGIEVAAARFSDVWFETTSFGRLAFFTLPCHKTDTIGMCITRSHPCTCSDNLAALCPYHALDTFIRRNHRPGTDRNDEYLFYGRRGGPITHLETIEVFRKAIASTGAELTRPDRWGSDAVRRYVQEAPLSCASGSSARPCISKTPTQMVKKYLETITSKFWVKNTSTNVIHISGAPEFSTENIHWHTLCGWRYGQAPHTRFWSLPEGNQCQRCFRMQENQAITDANSDEEAVWNAPSATLSLVAPYLFTRARRIDLTTDPVLKYLRAIKIITCSAISVYFQDDAAVTDLVKKLEGKFTYKGNDYDLGKIGGKHIVDNTYSDNTDIHLDINRQGEIMSQRVFTSLGTVNANRKKDDLDKRLIVDNKQQLVTKEPPDWDVR